MLLLLMGFMNYAVEMRSDAMLYKFSKSWFRSSEVNSRDTHTHTHTQEVFLYFFRNKESMLKNINKLSHIKLRCFPYICLEKLTKKTQKNLVS
jgi:hypothetical protein